MVTYILLCSNVILSSQKFGMGWYDKMSIFACESKSVYALTLDFRILRIIFMLNVTAFRFLSYVAY